MGPLVTALIQIFSWFWQWNKFENFVWQETITAENSHWQDLENSSKLVHLYGTMHKRFLTENRNYIYVYPMFGTDQRTDMQLTDA